MVVAHNHVKPQTIDQPSGSKGFRAWWTTPDDPAIVACRCRWAPTLGKHFRYRRKDDA
jgi:hypothetical protein